jgi:tetratricopeptide (TPR) repeat protein
VGLALALVLAGCGSSRQAAWETTAASKSSDKADAQSQSQRDALLTEAQSSWEQRSDEAKLRQAISTWEKALELDETDAETWTALSRGRYFLADCHLRFDESKKEEMVSTFEAGTQAAERALMATSPKFAEKMQAGARVEEALDLLDAEAVPAMYWRSSNMGKWGSAKDFATLLAYKDEVRAVMERTLELAPNFYFGGPHRYFGAYFARLPAFAGGDLARSKTHFSKSLSTEPSYFATHVLYAEDYAVKSQDRELYEEQLRFVLETDPEVLPPVAPENRCEQRKAQIAMDKVGEIFE